MLPGSREAGMICGARFGDSSRDASGPANSTRLSVAFKVEIVLEAQPTRIMVEPRT